MRGREARNAGACRAGDYFHCRRGRSTPAIDTIERVSALQGTLCRPRQMLGLIVGSMLAVLGGCASGPSGPETEPPTIQIQFPQNDRYDRDGDGLVDIEVMFMDAGSGIDSGSLVIESNRVLGPMGSGTTDILSAFTIREQDSLHVILEETTESLLPPGVTRLHVEVTDRSGNKNQASFEIDLPAGDFHTFVPSPVPGRFPIGIEIVPLDPESGDEAELVLLLSGFEILPFDPVALTFSDPIGTPFFSSPVAGEWDPGSRELYIVSDVNARLFPFDPAVLAFGPPVDVAARGIGSSRGRSGRFYVALVTTPAKISVVDPALEEEVAVIRTAIVDPLNPGQEAFIATPQPSLDEERLYVPLLVSPGGLVVVDVRTGQVLEHVDLDPTGLSMGKPVESAYDPQDGLLYLSELHRPGGLVVFDTQNHSIVGRTVRGGVGGKFPTLSPSGRRVFLTLAADPPDPPENWLLDSKSFELLQRIPIDNIGSSGANGSVFRADGQLVFVASGNGIAVYLNRE